jgi:hypothetical protein
MAARLAHKARLDVGEPEIVRPSIATDRDRLAARADMVLSIRQA